MKRLASFVAAVVLLGAPALAAEPAVDLSWITGTWVQQEGGKTVRETWSTPIDGAMGGVGQTSRPGKPPRFEFMTITPEAAGPTFTAYVDGQPATPFVLKPGPAGEATFENLAHDFPQRVIYRRCGADLCARIEGLIDGKLQGMDWRYRRAD
ncbi:MAG TPA: DUF6265 family protein [Caulobacter sp.]|nr:DUF6265 family protein [Caulobacter sp.]